MQLSGQPIITLLQLISRYRILWFVLFVVALIALLAVPRPPERATLDAEVVLPTMTPEGQQERVVQPAEPTTTPTPNPTSYPTVTSEGNHSDDCPSPDKSSATVQEAPTRVATPTRAWPEPYVGIWISSEELAALPTTGPAWQQLKAAADADIEEPDISDRDQDNDVYVLARALVYARTGEERYLAEVVDNIEEAMGTEDGGQTLALGRNLIGYVIAADLVNLPLAEPALDREFRDWLRELLTEEQKDDRSLQQTHELRPNNWGTHAGASRAAIAVYLQDEEELARTAQVFKGWLGDRESYAGFDYGRLGWQIDPENPVAINPPGAMLEGHSVDGSLPEEMRRAGRFQWPPKKTDYAWEGLQGALVQAEILYRAGYPTWEWEERALLRAVTFLYEIGWEAEGDDEWQPWLVNHAYGTDFRAVTPARYGKNMGWTDWTHSIDRDAQTGVLFKDKGGKHPILHT